MPYQLQFVGTPIMQRLVLYYKKKQVVGSTATCTCVLWDVSHGIYEPLSDMSQMRSVASVNQITQTGSFWECIIQNRRNHAEMSDDAVARV